VQIAYFGFHIAEVTCPTLYFEDASSINFKRSVKYGLGVLNAGAQFRLKKMGLARPSFLSETGRKLEIPSPEPGAAAEHRPPAVVRLSSS